MMHIHNKALSIGIGFSGSDSIYLNIARLCRGVCVCVVCVCLCVSARATLTGPPFAHDVLHIIGELLVHTQKGSRILHSVQC